MNEDAKRTFTHLLFRPGYMIRDYLRGKNDTYLSPMTALLVFYAFFSLVCSIVIPDVRSGMEIDLTDEVPEVIIGGRKNDEIESRLASLFQFVDKTYTLFHLDQKPEAADTKAKKSLASFEANLRNQGVQEFLGMFFVLWFSIWMLSRKRFGFTLSASATASAYILCQYSFFRLFTLILTLGQSTRLGALLIVMLLAFDYSQLFDISWKRSVRFSVLTGIYMALVYTTILTVVGSAVIVFFFL